MRRRIRVVVLALDRTLAVALLTLAAAFALVAGRETVEVLSSNLVVSSSARDAVSGRVVAIDAGHGGPDSGARASQGSSKAREPPHSAGTSEVSGPLRSAHCDDPH